jgi:putative ABC transport system ATP-binding protein
MIEVRNISKSYARGREIFTALKDVSIKIKKGGYCSITGASGAGKSTLLYSIGGLIHPDAGTIFHNGRNIYDQGGKYLDHYRRKKVGFMFQQFHLMPYLTVDENIRLACLEKSHRQAIGNYLELCSLSEVRYKYPAELSVGEKQRTAFIRAIISNPELLLADEPTGNLDPGNSTVLMSLIGTYHKSGGTVILVSHDPSAAGYSDLNIILDNGRIKQANVNHEKTSITKGTGPITN